MAIQFNKIPVSTNHLGKYRWVPAKLNGTIEEKVAIYGSAGGFSFVGDAILLLSSVWTSWSHKWQGNMRSMIQLSKMFKYYMTTTQLRMGKFNSCVYWIRVTELVPSPSTQEVCTQIHLWSNLNIMLDPVLQCLNLNHCSHSRSSVTEERENN